MKRNAISLFVISSLVILIIIELVFNCSFPLLSLLVIFPSVIISIVSILFVPILLKNKKQSRRHLLTLLTMLLLGIIYIGIGRLDRNKEVLISGHSHGIISGAEIDLYNDQTFKYCSDNLFMHICYRGTFEERDVEYLLKYNKNITPPFNSTHIYSTGERLVFISDEGDEVYEFQLDD